MSKKEGRVQKYTREGYWERTELIYKSTLGIFAWVNQQKQMWRRHMAASNK